VGIQRIKIKIYLPSIFKCTFEQNNYLIGMPNPKLMMQIISRKIWFSIKDQAIITDEM